MAIDPWQILGERSDTNVFSSAKEAGYYVGSCLEQGKRSQVLGSPFRVAFLLPNLRAIELKIDYLSAVLLWQAGYFCRRVCGEHNL